MIGIRVGQYEIKKQLGNLAEKVDALTFFVDIGEDADVALQPQVDYARDRIDELDIQSARETQ